MLPVKNMVANLSQGQSVCAQIGTSFWISLLNDLLIVCLSAKDSHMSIGL